MALPSLILINHLHLRIGSLPGFSLQLRLVIMHEIDYMLFILLALKIFFHLSLVVQNYCSVSFCSLVIISKMHLVYFSFSILVLIVVILLIQVKSILTL